MNLIQVIFDYFIFCCFPSESVCFSKQEEVSRVIVLIKMYMLLQSRKEGFVQKQKVPYFSPYSFFANVTVLSKNSFIKASSRHLRNAYLITSEQ